MAGTFAQELLAAMRSPAARLACLNVLAKYAGCSVYIPSDSKTERRERAAEHMLANGMNCAEAAQALRARFRVSERTARRTVSKIRGQLSASSGRIE